MARILVVGDRTGLAGRTLLHRLVRRLRSLGQDAALHGAGGEDPARSVQDADGVVAVLDAPGAETGAVVAYAHARNKPILGLAHDDADVPPFLAAVADVRRAADEDGWMDALPDFCERVRPFAGRLVRDRVPSLVREAGYDMTFRLLGPDEKPRFLKQKIASEAAELERADVGREKEEVADVLEALEAFLVARGFDRDDLRRVKEAKRKRRGGFEQCYVVEATTPADDPGPTPEAQNGMDAAQTPPAPEPVPETDPEPEAGPAQVPDIDFEFPDEEPVEETRVDAVGPDRTVQSNFFEL